MLCFVPWRQVFFHHVFQKSSLERDGKDPVRAPGCTQAGGQMLGHLRTWGALRGGEGPSGLSLAAGGGLEAFRTLKHPRLDIGSCVQHMVCTREVASWVGQSSVRLDSGLVSGWERRVQPCGQQS